MDDEYEYALVEWAHTYNGYQRLADSPEHLWEVVRPLDETFERSGEIPEWAGVDLLRGWVFYVVRAHRHGGHGSLREEHPEFEAIVEAINRHPAASVEDRPPVRTR